LVSGFDKAFICNDILYSKLNKIEKKYLVSIVKSKHLIKYKFINSQKYILLNDANIKNFKKEFPNFYNHFEPFKTKLLERYDYKNGINYWDWSFLRSYKLQKTDQKKICIPCKLRIKSYEDINFSLVDEKYLLTQDVTSIFINKELKEDIRYILGFLNSSVVKKWIFINNNNRGNVLEFSEEPLKNIPIKLIDWKNKFEANIIGSKGSLHVNCLCKWGPSTLTLRKRILPSGKPKEVVNIRASKDPTWEKEEKYFKKISRKNLNNFRNDLVIKKTLRQFI